MDTTVEGGEIDPLNDPDIVFDSVSYEPTDEGKGCPKTRVVPKLSRPTQEPLC